MDGIIRKGGHCPIDGELLAGVLRKAGNQNECNECKYTFVYGRV